ncbi:hypothetical protein PUNSTDRAFT_118338 [Punctularia strigosozonata HHB-11173 SS5]|uniref:uncharacterized protein n=1 Tax=Punctularia strigosozonata (strain HHB-11173) TaxID=741275 RepID=UPI00044163DF|nr:uncharacterized protein PUNSTDRAFT_118338 [Punctularia strigosozonata HHB-11173 SS5]EIN12544.1 hypothetical protein PUNSTDRAFT_118338 [Punctularia strigosozonata HHB-11173 SS5]
MSLSRLNLLRPQVLPHIRVIQLIQRRQQIHIKLYGVRTYSKGISKYGQVVAKRDRQSEVYAPPVSGSSLPTATLLERINNSYSSNNWEDTTTEGTAENVPRNTEGSAGADTESLDAYFALRHRDRGTILQLPPSVFTRLSQSAFSLESVAALADVAQDAVEAFARDEDERARQLRHLINLAARLPDFPRLRILSMLRTLQLCTNVPMTLSQTTLAALLDGIFRAPSPETRVDRAVLRLIQPLFVAYIRDDELSARSFIQRSARTAHADFVWAAFAAVVRLAHCSLPQESFALFEALTEAGYVPPEATRDPLVQSGTSFEAIVLAGLVRAALHWGWLGRAIALLDDRADHVSAIEPALHDFIVDVMYSLLRGGKPNHVRAAATVLAKIVRRGYATRRFPPDRLFRLFYDRALHYRLSSVAAFVFSATVPGDREHRFPVPAGPSFLWLFKHLAVEEKNVHLARVLVERLAEQQEETPISMYSRGKIVAIAAENGYGRSARTVWERWMKERDWRQVAGYAPAMLRLVSLYMAKVRRIEERLPEGVVDMLDAEEGEAIVRPPSAEQEEKRLAALARRQHQSVVAESLDTDVIGYEAEDDSQKKKESASSPPAEMPDDDDLLGYGEEVRDQVALMKDYLDFAQRVAAEFRKVQEPIRDAPHAALNALARAYFLIGDFPSGFELFRVVLRRREVPDMRDLNVALSAMAEGSPRSAAAWIKRMIRRGVEPDEVTFGTVIHQAFTHDDRALVEWLLRTARTLGHGKLTNKSMSAYIRGLLSDRRNGQEGLRQALESAMTLIESAVGGPYVATANMGELCVATALEADMPAMAFRFWKMLIAGRTEEGDAEQVGQRRAIATRLRAHVSAGRMGAGAAEGMLLELEGLGVRV